MTKNIFLDADLLSALADRQRRAFDALAEAGMVAALSFRSFKQLCKYLRKMVRHADDPRRNRRIRRRMAQKMRRNQASIHP